ncbi:SusE domain-containing protein [Aquirufa rosea]|nr:SusE domain-containing protein [Aquirufa rosea]
MKKSMLKIFSLIIFSLGLISCEKEFIQPVLTASTGPSITLSKATAVLVKEEVANEALTVSWPKPDYGFTAAASYTILIDKKGGDFSKAVAVSVGGDLKKTFKVGELNPILLQLGLKAGVASGVDFKLQSVIGPTTSFLSPAASFTVTPFLDKLDLSTNWGVVGSATPGGWNGPDLPFYKTDVANVLVAYVDLAVGEIKFRTDNKWDYNVGDGGSGSIKVNGDNIKVNTAGSYKITLDLTKNTYTIIPYSWGVVGSSAPNGWGGPDVPFWYDPATDQWRAIVKLVKGEIKIRFNNDWSLNYGDDGANGTLEAGGANIAIGADGFYLITFNQKELKVKIETFKVWGIVGSATAGGWGGPDTKFRPDFGNEGIWYLNNISLSVGEIKFRLNDDWGVNYGDDGANGSLESGGANIAIGSAGVYNVKLDFRNPAAPTYTLIKN